MNKSTVIYHPKTINITIIENSFTDNGPNLKSNMLNVTRREAL